MCYLPAKHLSKGVGYGFSKENLFRLLIDGEVGFMLFWHIKGHCHLVNLLSDVACGKAIW